MKVLGGLALVVTGMGIAGICAGGGFLSGLLIMHYAYTTDGENRPTEAVKDVGEALHNASQEIFRGEPEAPPTPE